MQYFGTFLLQNVKRNVVNFKKLLKTRSFKEYNICLQKN